MSVTCYDAPADPVFHGFIETAEGQREVIARSYGYSARRENSYPPRNYDEFVDNMYAPSANELFEPEPKPTPHLTAVPAVEPEPKKPTAVAANVERELSWQPEEYDEDDLRDIVVALSHSASKLLNLLADHGITGLETAVARFLLSAEFIRKIYENAVEERKVKAKQEKRKAKENHPALALV